MNSSRSAATTVPRLKYLTVVAVLICWIVVKFSLFVGSYIEHALWLLTAACWLAFILLLLAEMAWRLRNEDLSLRLGWKFSLLGPSGVATIFTVALMVFWLISVWLYRQRFPGIPSLEEFRPFIRVHFAILAGFTMEFYVIVGAAGLIIRFIHVIEDFIGRR